MDQRLLKGKHATPRHTTGRYTTYGPIRPLNIRCPCNHVHVVSDRESDQLIDGCPARWKTSRINLKPRQAHIMPDRVARVHTSPASSESEISVAAVASRTVGASTVVTLATDGFGVE